MTFGNLKIASSRVRDTIVIILPNRMMWGMMLLIVLIGIGSASSMADVRDSLIDQGFNPGLAEQVSLGNKSAVRIAEGILLTSKLDMTNQSLNESEILSREKEIKDNQAILFWGILFIMTLGSVIVLIGIIFWERII